MTCETSTVRRIIAAGLVLGAIALLPLTARGADVTTGTDCFREIAYVTGRAEKLIRLDQNRELTQERVNELLRDVKALALLNAIESAHFDYIKPYSPTSTFQVLQPKNGKQRFLFRGQADVAILGCECGPPR